MTISPAAFERPTGFPLESNTRIPVSPSLLLTVNTLKKAIAAVESTFLWSCLAFASFTLKNFT